METTPMQTSELIDFLQGDDYLPNGKYKIEPIREFPYGNDPRYKRDNFIWDAF